MPVFTMTAKKQPMAKNGTAIHFCDGHFFKLSEDFRCAGHKAKVKGRESF